jgi:hypothetical protein
VSEDAPAPGGLDPLAVVGELTDALEGARSDLRSLRGELKSVREDSEARDGALTALARRRGRVITGVIISIFLDLPITAGFGWNTIRVNDAENSTHASDVQQCQLANVVRSQDIAIWNLFLADLGAATAGTPRTTAELAQVARLVKVKDTPRNCTSAYPGR